MRGFDALAVGNPVRRAVLSASADRARERFGLHAQLPVVLITGGGTGALRLNEVAMEAARILKDACQIIHLTGPRRSAGGWSHPNYHPYEFLAAGMAEALVVSDLVVTRAGMSTMAEIAALRKAAIVIPMPRSHQEANAAAFQRRRGAVIMEQDGLTAEGLVGRMRALLAAPEDRAALGSAAAHMLPSNAADTIAGHLVKLAGG
jgi:UDP-N-acetylglucosamine--N-acetylmuramyl-(pentapeptide) pyrophosphoryl-undecaprenol N-acetylglucosamine transferase